MQPGEFSEETIRMATEYLDPDRIRGVMIHIGLFMLSFEQLRHSILEQPRSYFSDHWEFVDGDLKSHPTERYNEEVTSLDEKRVFEASLKFLMKHGVISDADKSEIISLLNYRNLMAHQPHKLLDIQNSSIQSDAVDKVMKHHRNIGRFWALAAADTDLDPEDKDVENGATILLNYMIAAANGTRSDPPSK